MSTRKQALLREAQQASQGYAHARKQLADAQFCQRNGMANNLMAAASLEHVAYHRWIRAVEAYNAL